MTTLVNRVGSETGALARVCLQIGGAVQGVGFRPFLFRLATDLSLRGWISNSPQGVCAELEGTPQAIQELLLRIEPERPVHSSIQSFESVHLDPAYFERLEIRPSREDGAKTVLILPDFATCPECLEEILDPLNRRYRYPFTNCTHCGPRFSIIEALPYDRKNTSMARFAMCPLCQAEYEDPSNRRFHAQPNACPECGPQLELWDRTGKVLAQRDAALSGTVAALQQGKIVALKGLGGFQLLADATNESAVRVLRARKHREEKPLAIMAASLSQAAQLCEISPLEARLLQSAESPIVLLRRHEVHPCLTLATSVAPGNPYLGVMLPYTPLHHLLLQDVQLPVVATSGNISDEPICTDEQDALARLAGLADVFLVHNRRIVRHVDDSIARVILGRELVTRRARGYAPLPIQLPFTSPGVLAVGAHLKSTIGVAIGANAFLSQHIGDLDTTAAFAAFTKVSQDLTRLLGAFPESVVADLHPDYASTRHAHTLQVPTLCVQHHYAHVLSCMAENRVSAPLLGISWDGTGYGLDQTIWGGEFLAISSDSFFRKGHFRTFRLPGGELAVREPRRSALGLLYELLGNSVFGRRDIPAISAFSPAELRTLSQALAKGVNCPSTSSAGRLFDAVAAILGLRQKVGFEGQAALDLEFALEPDESDDSYPVALCPIGPAGNGAPPIAPVHPNCSVLREGGEQYIADWGPMILTLLEDQAKGLPVWEISARFHNSLAEFCVLIAQKSGQLRVVLTGGCFQNKFLLERVVGRLRSEGFSPYWHQRVPPNDGGIALGQLMASGRQA
jgi:hydrogenase maturation protein HypF